MAARYGLPSDALSKVFFSESPTVVFTQMLEKLGELTTELSGLQTESHTLGNEPESHSFMNQMVGLGVVTTVSLLFGLGVNFLARKLCRKELNQNDENHHDQDDQYDHDDPSEFVSKTIERRHSF